MSRLLMTLFGSLLLGASAWCVVGFAAAQIAMKMGNGGSDGGGVMSGFFFIGGIGGLAGAGLGGWFVWNQLADPSRTGLVGIWLVGLLIVLVAGITFTMTPKHLEPNDFPEGKRGEFQVEAKVPSSRIAAFAKGPGLTFELRAGGFFLAVPWQRAQIRQLGDSAIVPASFRVQQVRQWVLAIMEGENQIDTLTAGMENFNGILNDSTEWSPWITTDSGLAVRWRFAVLAK